jgi:hypothetical protein
MGCTNPTIPGGTVGNGSPLVRQSTSGTNDGGVMDRERIRSTSRYLRAAWALLILLGAFYLFAPISDLVADAKTGIPSDHRGTFTKVADVTWGNAEQTAAGPTKYVTLLEVAYAVHGLVFGILFIVIVAIPFRQRQWWAWWACWAVMLANLTYSLTFGRHDTTILYRSLIADILLPVLLLVHIPAFFGGKDQSVTAPASGR